MITDPFIQGTKEELVESLHKNAEVGSPRFEQQKMAIVARCASDIEHSLLSLEKSINNNAKSNDNLARKIFYLNIILVIASCVGVLISYFEYIN